MSNSEALLKTGRTEAAEKVILQARALRPDDPRLFRLLAKASEYLGKKAESHRLLAEAYLADGKLQPAIRQLEIALKKKEGSDFYELSKIEARLKELKALHKQQKSKE